MKKKRNRREDIVREMEVESFVLDLKLEHNEIISHVSSLIGGREVFYIEGIGNSFFLVWDSTSGFHISYTEDAVLNHHYYNGSAMHADSVGWRQQPSCIRVPNMMKIKMLYQQIIDTKMNDQNIWKLPFGKKIMKVAHLHTNYTKEENSLEVQSSEYLIVIENHIGILMYYKDYGYSIVNRSYANTGSNSLFSCF